MQLTAVCKRVFSQPLLLCKRQQAGRREEHPMYDIVCEWIHELLGDEQFLPTVENP
jgi:hypothetical protein